VVNILVFLWQQGIGLGMYAYTMVPYVLTQGHSEMIRFDQTVVENPALHPAWLTIFTSMFMHGGFMHIAGNMLYLWVFGDNIEGALGKGKYLAFYLLVGLAATLAHIASNPASQVPTLGASGAIAGVMGGYILLFPTANVKCLVPWGFFSTLMDVPAWIVLGIWIAYQILLNSMGAAGHGGGGVAYMAHIGGFAAGALLIKVFGGRRPEPRRYGYRDW
jgi:membrane associated rhomboid family serine protease